MSDKPKLTYKQTTVIAGQSTPTVEDRLTPEAIAKADAKMRAEDEERRKQLAAQAEAEGESSEKAREIGGPKGPEPTRFGDWEHKGRCIDF